MVLCKNNWGWTLSMFLPLAKACRSGRHAALVQAVVCSGPGAVRSRMSIDSSIELLPKSSSIAQSPARRVEVRCLPCLVPKHNIQP